MKKFILSLALLLVLSISPALAADPYCEEGGVVPGQITNTVQNIVASDTAIVFLPTGAGHVVIQLSPASAAVNVNFNNGTATAANFQIPPGGSVTYYGRALNGIHYLGASATGTISVLAW